MQLEDYDITPEGGFLAPYDMNGVELPAAFAPVEEAAMNLGGLLTAGRVRPVLDDLPQIDMAGHLPGLSDAQRRLLMVRYSFLVQAYVWGSDQPPACLPRNLATSYCALAEAIGQYPLLPYSGYTLDNWARIDPDGDITLENIRVLQNFLGGMDENWFILVHVEIEARAGPALAAIPPLLDAADKGDIKGVRDELAVIRAAWARINPVFDRMPERCDPYIYYNRVRPYIHGWEGNPALPGGLIYEGVEKYGGEPQAFRGQTGAQSSIVPTMDALFGIEHERDPLREYLDELHTYRPPGHRRFIEDVGARSKLRALVETSDDRELRHLYDSCLDHIQAFRTRHLEFAAEYINKQAGKDPANPTDVGTGGTPFMTYLKKHRDESRRAMHIRHSNIGKRVRA
jgi:indoleamine 2,3-dioxygenase